MLANLWEDYKREEAKRNRLLYDQLRQEVRAEMFELLEQLGYPVDEIQHKYNEIYTTRSGIMEEQ